MDLSTGHLKCMTMAVKTTPAGALNSLLLSTGDVERNHATHAVEHNHATHAEERNHAMHAVERPQPRDWCLGNLVLDVTRSVAV